MREVTNLAGGATALAKKAAVPLRSLNDYLAGSKLPVERAALFAAAANVSLVWLATGEGPMRFSDRLQDSAAGEPDEFVLVPRYDIQASAGPGAFADSEAVLDHIAFRAAWLRGAFGGDPARLVLITAAGESMSPTIRPGDLLLIDTAVDRIIDDAIYVLGVESDLVVKRVQRFLGGALVVKSDNPAYAEQAVGTAAGQHLSVAGRVLWIARMI